MRRTIFILEDNEDRITAMRQCLADKFPFFETRFARTAFEATTWLTNNLSRAICISLDHDLERPADRPDMPDPGTGREVADHLAAQPSGCPIIIHSTNTHAAVGMEMALEDAGWSVQRLSPYADLQWVREAWLPIVRQAILDNTAAPARGSDTSVSLH